MQLIGNALKYTLEGGIKVFVRYGAAEVEFGVEVGREPLLPRIIGAVHG